MAGHSKWANIKHKKARSDAKRGKLWSKCARAIIVAARNGGGDPASNLTLRYAIDDARSANMPKDTIENAIKKGTGELAGDNYEGAIYEGYGPGGVAVLCEILTNNRNRTAGEARKIFERFGGNMSGSCAYIFANKGQVMVNKIGGAADASEEKLMDVALEAGAEDVTDEGDAWQVLCELSQFTAVRDAIEQADFSIESASITMIPNTTVSVTGDVARQVIGLVDALEDHDDVQKVHANFEVPDEELAALEG